MSKVLLIEDEADLLLIMNTTFLSEGFETITAMSGDEGYDKAMEHNPDIIVSDVLMPRTNGLDLCKKLKATAQFSNTPVILVTALYKGKDYEEMAKTYGADAVLSKPYEPTELVGIARSLLTDKSKGKPETEDNDKKYPLDLSDA